MNELEQHVLAAYYSDARLNIMFCLNDVREKMGLKAVIDEAQIAEMFHQLWLTDTTPERQSNLIRLLRKCFPFIDVMVDRGKKGAPTHTPEHYDDLFCWLFHFINNMRDTLVHPAEAETKIDYPLHTELFYALNKVYDSGLRTIETRFNLDANDIKALRRCNDGGMAKPVKSFSLALCTDLKSNKNKPAQNQSDVLHDFGRVLLCSLFLEKSQSAELVSHFWKTDHGKRWNDRQKSIIRELLSVNRVRLPLQRFQPDHKPTTVTLNTLTELARCPRLLFDLLTPEDQNRFRVGSTLLPGETDVDNESSYLLRRGFQNRFIPLIMRFFDFDPGSKLRFAIDLGQFYYNVRMKAGDQFADERPRVRRLGQKIIAYGRLLDFEKAKKPDAWQRLESNCSESANEEELLKDRSLTGAGAIEQLKPYIVKTYPHYHFDEDKIGIRLDSGNGTATYPDLGINPEKAGQKAALDPLKKQEKRVLMAPDFWISPNLMVDLAFYHHLQKEHNRYPSIENILKQYRSGMTRLIKDLKNNRPSLGGEPNTPERRAECQNWINSIFESDIFFISMADLPKVISRYLVTSSGWEISANDILGRVHTLLQETYKKQREIEHLLKYPKKRGKKGFRPIKCGHIGDFLSEDLMRFQPKDTGKDDGGKLNSQHYQILQAALAYYGAHLDEPPRIVDLLKNAGLLSGDFQHPFLPGIINEENTNKYKALVDFYKSYLEARKKFLCQYLAKTENQSAIAHLPGWLRLRKPSTMEKWLKEQFGEQSAEQQLNDKHENLLQPLPVPKSLFYQPLLNMTSAAMNLSPEELCEKGTQVFTRNDQEVKVKPSVSWLIKKYLKYQGDSVQKMYRHKRRHDLFDTYRDSRSKKQRFQKKNAHYLKEKIRRKELKNVRTFVNGDEDEEKGEKLKKLLRIYKRHERQIRQVSTQDMVLHLYTKPYLHDTLQWLRSESEPDWSLKDIQNNLLKSKIRYELPAPGTDKIIFHPECKIKNLGGLRLLARDRRLPSLMPYYSKEEKKFDHQEIRSELDAYSRARVRVFKKVHELELKIDLCCDRASVPPDQIKYFGAGRHGLLLYMLYQHFQKQLFESDSLQTIAAGLDVSCFDKARLIRNAFAHNEYPKTERFDEIVCKVGADIVPGDNPANHRKVAERLVMEMDDIYKPWFDFLDSRKGSR